jgi:hypothetical protein
MFRSDIKASFKADVEEIHIYDFDSTLFHSPMPNPLLWGNSSGRVISELDWFSHIQTLPADKHDWFHPEMLQCALESLQKSTALVLLMTGRKREIFDIAIRKLCSAVGLHFPLLLCKEPGFDNTFHFKSTVLRDLLALYSMAKVYIYDDRIGHLNQFALLLSQMNVQHEIRHIQHTLSSRLPEHEEFDLVKLMVHNYNQYNRTKIHLRQVVDYTCILLSAESKQSLLGMYPPRQGWNAHCDHITLCLGLQPNALMNIGKVGDDIKFTATHYGCIESQIEALMVSVHGKQYHITLNVAPGIKPKKSLEILQWRPISPIELFGFVHQRIYHNVEKIIPAIPKLALGKLVRQIHPHIKALPAACKIVKEWIFANSIAEMPENEPQILQYIASNEFLEKMKI